MGLRKLQRRAPHLRPLKLIYIFSEGLKTEPYYFKSFKKEIRSKTIKIEVIGKGMNTVSLVEAAIKQMTKEKIKVDGGMDSDECWVVFDKDDFDKTFPEAIRLAEKHGLLVAYSNESFELWYLLHFSYMTSKLHRSDYITKLNSLISGGYEKNAENIYETLKPKQQDPIRNAKKLEKEYVHETDYNMRNPCTTVYKLVERLNQLIKS